MAKLFTLCLLALFTSCATATFLPDGSMKTIADEREGMEYFLTHSMYSGAFYDDDRRNLLNDRRFDHVEALTRPAGEIVYPPRARDILAVGTKVKVRSIIFPTRGVIFRRPLYSPRYLTWLEVNVVTPTGLIDRERTKPHVILLPSGLKEKAAFDKYFGLWLTLEDPKPWLTSLEPRIQKAIAQKRVVLGMDAKAVVASFGLPDKRKAVQENIEGQNIQLEILQWGDDQTVWLTEGKVTKVLERPGLPSPLPLRH